MNRVRSRLMARMLYSAERAESAVHGEDDAGDETRRIAAKELRGAVELRDVSETAHRRLGDHLDGTVRQGSVVLEQGAAVLLSDEETGRERVDADLVAVFEGDFRRQPFREVGYALLGDAVAGHARDRLVRGHGRDVQDVATALLLH